MVDVSALTWMAPLKIVPNVVSAVNPVRISLPPLHGFLATEIILVTIIE